MRSIATQPLAALATPGNTMVATGITPEAIEQNPIIYELMGEMGWRSRPFDLDAWVDRYARRRYGSDLASTAWRLLHRAAYQYHFYKSRMVLRPALDMGYQRACNATVRAVARRRARRTEHGGWRAVRT